MEMAKNLAFMTDEDDVLTAQRETTEATDFFRLYPMTEGIEMEDVREILKRCSKGAILAPHDFLQLYELATNSNLCREMWKNAQKERFPELAAYFTFLGIFTKLEQAIQKTIDEEGVIKDSASPELARIRRAIQQAHSNIKTKLDAILRSNDNDKVLQDKLITMRNDRYVVPVKTEQRQAMPGLIHDKSATGATLFIEPAAIVNLNNQLKELLLDEKQEIERILTALTNMVYLQIEELEKSFLLLGTIDFIFAKARLSAKMDACEPILNKAGQIALYRSRHPLLKGHVVANDIIIGENYHTIIITGPNTGGKTVVLKTIGLLCLMYQAGLHIPVDAGSNITIFDKVYCDIGDEQSIEQSLSTYSSHIKNIIHILAGIRGKSLVLLDELGAGTDPVEGGALARAILIHLHQANCYVLATTHYGELKSFAYETEGVTNANVEFDSESLRPTFKLLIGLPGTSNALDIAWRLGLPEKVVEKARSLMDKRELEMADMLSDIDSMRRSFTEKNHEIERLRQETEHLQKQIRQDQAKAAEKEKQLLERAHSKAEGILQQTRQEAQALLEEIKLAAKQNTPEQLAKAKQALLKISAKEMEKSQTVRLQKPLLGKASERFNVGDSVFITSLQQKGTVLEIKNKQALVQIGILKFTVKQMDLRLLEEEQQDNLTSGYQRMTTAKKQDIRPELDLRGITYAEAIEKTEKYLDDAALAGMKQISIIHGKGTGVLREAVRNVLKLDKRVKSARLGAYGEGDSGVTVVELK